MLAVPPVLLLVCCGLRFWDTGCDWRVRFGGPWILWPPYPSGAYILDARTVLFIPCMWLGLVWPLGSWVWPCGFWVWPLVYSPLMHRYIHRLWTHTTASCGACACLCRTIYWALWISTWGCLTLHRLWERNDSFPQSLHLLGLEYETPRISHPCAHRIYRMQYQTSWCQSGSPQIWILWPDTFKNKVRIASFWTSMFLQRMVSNEGYGKISSPNMGSKLVCVYSLQCYVHSMEGGVCLLHAVCQQQRVLSASHAFSTVSSPIIQSVFF